MAALSVAYHGAEPGVPEAVTEGFDKLPLDSAMYYREYAFNTAPLAVQRILEQLMNTSTWPVYGPFAKEHFGRGKKEGRGESILDVLEARGLDVSEAERERITSCTDLRRLKKWVKRAATAEKTGDLFAGESGTGRSW